MHDPNNYNEIEDVEYWLGMSSFYRKDFDGVGYFDGLDEMSELINDRENNKKVHEEIISNNEQRRNKILNYWKGKLCL